MAGFMPSGLNPNLGFLMPYMSAQDRGLVGQVMGGGQVAGGYGGMPTSAANYSYLGNGQYGIFGGGQHPGSQMPQTPQDLFSMQQKANTDTREYNRGLWNDVRNYTIGVPQTYDADPMNQGARNLSAQLLANPEAINDRTQQLMINRASNLANAGANVSRAGAMQDLANRGIMGGQAQRAALAPIERNRVAALANVGSQAEMDRALRRNQDYAQAIQLGSGLAGQRANVYADASKTLMSGVPYEAPTDYSGLGGLLGMNGGLGSGFSGGFINGTNMGIRHNSPQNPYATQLNGMQDQGGFVNQFGAYQDNYNPQRSIFGGGAAYADANGNGGQTGFWNQYQPPAYDQYGRPYQGATPY